MVVMFMNNNIKRIKLYVKNTTLAHEVEKVLKEELLQNNFEINNEIFDLVISVGGDGTFLKMVHDNNFNPNIYYASVNAGSLGFLTTIDKSQINELINNLKNNNFNVTEVDVLKTRVYFGKEVKELNSINEFVLRKCDFSSLRCDILIDEQLLDKYVGDGLVVSTSLGSTGYNMALGGPIIDKEASVISITPIVPINNRVYKSLSNPFIINPKRKISFVLHDNLCLLSDGKINNVSDIKKIECALSKNSIKCLMPNDYINNIKCKIIDSGD